MSAYSPGPSDSIRGEFQENYRYAHDYWSPFVSAAKLYTLAASGYTWSDREIRELTAEGREPLEMNIMRRPLQFFSGYLRDNLNSVVFSPVEGSDQKTADQLTKLSYYVWDKGHGYSTFLDSCDEMMKSGISLCGIQMDYSKDIINGDISFYKRCFNQFYIDPTFEKIDLSDCSFCIMRDLLDKNSVKQLLPFVDPKVIDDIQTGFRDDKFLSYHPNFTTLSRSRNLLAYDQYYRRTTRMRTFLIDEESSYYRDITDLSSEEMKKLKMGLKRIRDLHDEAELLGLPKNELPVMLDIREESRPYIELHIMLNGQEVYCGEDKTGIVETFPFVPLLCFMEPSIWMPSQRIQGLASTLYSAQRQFNKRHMKIVDMMDSTISTGYKYFIGSVADPEDLQQSGQNKLIGIDPENAPAGIDSVKELQGGTASPALIEYQAILDKLTLTLANVNESVLGVDEKGNTQISGRLAQVRIAQGLRSNRKMFDNIELSQRILGGLVGKAIQLNYPVGKVKRILGEDPTSQFYEKDFEQYDAVIKEGIRSQSQRDAYYYELLSLVRDQIIDVPKTEIIRAMQMAGLSDLEQAIGQQEQQQKQAEAEAAKTQQDFMKAQTEEKISASQERKARALSDLALKDEREAKASQDASQSMLDRAKTIVEIAKLRDDRILQVLEFLNMLSQQEQAQRQEQSMETEAQLNRLEQPSSEPQQQPAPQETESISPEM